MCSQSGLPVTKGVMAVHTDWWMRGERLPWGRADDQTTADRAPAWAAYSVPIFAKSNQVASKTMQANKK